MKITTRTTLHEIQAQLRADGFPAALPVARAVKKAALKGCLLWTKEKLVTTDASRISEVPQ